MTCDQCKRKLIRTRYYWRLREPGRYCSEECRRIAKEDRERAPRYVKSHNPFYDDDFRD